MVYYFRLQKYTKEMFVPQKNIKQSQFDILYFNIFFVKPELEVNC